MDISTEVIVALFLVILAALFLWQWISDIFDI